MTHLYIIRHAESVLAHSQHIRDIMTEDALTPEGIRQAERLRDRLASTGEIAADALLASTYPRAYQTAEIIAPALQLPVGSILNLDTVGEITAMSDTPEERQSDNREE